MNRVYDIFIDYGILRNVLKKKALSVSQKFQQSLAEKLIEVGQSDLTPHFLSTPIMTLEYLGKLMIPTTITSSDLKQRLISILEKNPFNAEQIVTEGIELLKNELELSTVTDYGYLISQFSVHNEHRCPWGKQLAESIILDNLKNISTRYRFVIELAIDEFQGFNLREVYGDLSVDDRIARICASLGNFLPHKQFNVAIPRAVNQFYRNTRIGHIVNETISLDYDFTASHQDRLDTQIIHFACFGNKRDNSIFPVICFTCEAWERTEKRARAYLLYLVHLERLGQLRSEEYCPGKIVQIWQNSGEIRNEIDLKVLKDELLEQSIESRE